MIAGERCHAKEMRQCFQKGKRTAFMSEKARDSHLGDGHRDMRKLADTYHDTVTMTLPTL